MGIFDSETSTVNNNAIADLQAGYLPGIYGAATDLYNQGAPGYYPGSTVAAFDPVRAQGLNLGVDTALGAQTDLANNQTGLLNNILSGNDPYTNQLAQQAAAGVASSFGQAGSLGSARNYQQGNLAASDAILSRQLDASQQVNQAQQNALAPSNTLRNIGTDFQAHNQNIIDEDKQRYDFQSDQPWNHLERYQDIITQPSASAYEEGTTSSSSPSTFDTIVGVGSVIAGLPINQGGIVSRQKLMNHQSGMLAQGGMAPRRRMSYGMLAEGGDVEPTSTPSRPTYFAPNQRTQTSFDNDYIDPRATASLMASANRNITSIPSIPATSSNPFSNYQKTPSVPVNPTLLEVAPMESNVNSDAGVSRWRSSYSGSNTTPSSSSSSSDRVAQAIAKAREEAIAKEVSMGTLGTTVEAPVTNSTAPVASAQVTNQQVNTQATPTSTFSTTVSPTSTATSSTVDPSYSSVTQSTPAISSPGVNIVSPGAYAPVDTISTQYDNSNWTRPAAGHGWAVIDGRYQLVPTSQGIQPGGGTTYTPNQIAAPVSGGTSGTGTGGTSGGGSSNSGTIGSVVKTDAAGNPAPYLGFDIYDWDGNDSFLTNAERDELSGVISNAIGRDYDPTTDVITEAERELVNNDVNARIAQEDIYHNNQVIYGPQTGNNLTSATTGNVTGSSTWSKIKSFFTGDKSHVIDSQGKNLADKAGSTLNPDGTYNIDNWYPEGKDVTLVAGGGNAETKAKTGVSPETAAWLAKITKIQEETAKGQQELKERQEAARIREEERKASFTTYAENKAIREAGGNVGDGGGSGSSYNRSPGTIGNIGSNSYDYGVSSNYGGTGTYNPPGTSTTNRVVNTDDCFTGSSIVEIPNGKSRMDGLHIGDKVIDANGNTNTITNIIETTLGDRKQIGFNGNTAFTTEEHPFKIKGKGWSAVNPSANTRNNLEVNKIEVGDVFSNGVEVKSIDYNDSASDTKLYDLVLDGTHEYVVNGYEVHNKNQGGLIRKHNGYNQGGRVSKLPAWMNFRNQYGV